MLHQRFTLPGRSTGFRFAPVLLAVGAAAVMHSATTVKAQTYGLFNTGIDPTAMMGGAEDSHYTVTTPGGTTEPLFVTDLSTLPYQPGDDAVSSFVSPQTSYPAGVVDPGGVYDFTTTFDLTGVDLSTISILGRFESDDDLQNVYLNGTPLNIALASPGDYENFSPYFNLVPSASALNQGTNTLTFQVFNDAGTSIDPVALRTEFLTAVPEPSVWATVAGLGSLLLFGGWLRRRRATV